MSTYSTFGSVKDKHHNKPASLRKNIAGKVPLLQPKLTIGTPNDRFEQEADRVADQVVNTPATSQPSIQKKCSGCEQEEQISKKPMIQKMVEEEVQAKYLPGVMRMEEEEVQPKLQLMPDEELQTKQTNPTAQVPPFNLQADIQQSRGGGSPLASPTRSFMESQIGADFSKVRIHTDSKAQRLSTKLNAQAFATGNDIFFNKGKFNPETQSGKHLLAHELTHTVQQKASLQPKIQKQEEESIPPQEEPTGLYHPESDISRILGPPSENASGGYSKYQLVSLQQYIATLHKEEPAATLIARNVLAVYFHGYGEAIYQDCLKGVTHFMKVYMSQRKDLTLGEKLLMNYPNGVPIAFYGHGTAGDAKPAAIKWAKQHQSVSLKGQKAKAENVIFGKAISDDHKIQVVVPKIAKVLEEAVEATETFYGLQLKGSGIGKIKTLALFAHGTSNWCGVNFGGGLTRNTVTSKMKQVVPALTDDVTVIAYACSTSSDPDEDPAWHKGVMAEGDGRKSLAAGIRDMLVDSGKKEASVWGHTEPGGSITNATLRYFNAAGGKNSKGKSFVFTHAFGDTEIKQVMAEVKKELVTLGYDLSSVNQSRFDKGLYIYVQMGYKRIGMYQAVMKANKHERYNKMYIAEAAPLHPVEVGNFLRKYWKDTYWPANKDKFVKNMAGRFKLKKIK